MAFSSAHLPPSNLADGQYEVLALEYASQPARRRSENFLQNDPHDGPMPTSFFIWILRNRERTILVDTGFQRRAAAERDRDLVLVPCEALEQIGVPPASVRDIILTHMHFDHAGGLENFPNARIHLQDAEMTYATGRCMCDEAIRHPFDVEDVVHTVRRVYQGDTVFHDGRAKPFPGIELVPLPGHSKGLQAVEVETPRGRIMLASDATHFYENFLFSKAFAITIDLADTMETYAYLRAFGNGAEDIIPGHDPIVHEIFPDIEVGGIKLLELHRAPRKLVRDALKSPQSPS